ncbi:MAG: protein kinase [Oscillospiraceae bacterium]|nr:protein kinase [Oscillospiraceae bacterium]
MNGQYQEGDVVLGEWKLVCELGSGSYGKVYEAHREDYNEIFKSAIKIITIPRSQKEVTSIRNQGMDDASVTQYFETLHNRIAEEIKLMSRLKGTANVVSYEDHKTIPHTNGIGWDIIIRMELLTPLATHLLKNKLKKRDIIRLGTDICRALELCQRYNIVHRDVKPDNIFVSDVGDFKLGDFGIARTLRASEDATKAGSPPYMAPEVCKDNPHYDSTVDIYSLGIVLYQLLNNGRLPFFPPAPQILTPDDGPKAYARRISGETLPPPQNASAELAAVILKACAFHPADRFQTPAEMREALEKASQQENAESAAKNEKKIKSAPAEDSRDLKKGAPPEETASPVKPEKAESTPQPPEESQTAAKSSPEPLISDGTISEFDPLVGSSFRGRGAASEEGVSLHSTPSDGTISEFDPLVGSSFRGKGAASEENASPYSGVSDGTISEFGAAGSFSVKNAEGEKESAPPDSQSEESTEMVIDDVPTGDAGLRGKVERVKSSRALAKLGALPLYAKLSAGAAVLLLAVVVVLLSKGGSDAPRSTNEKSSVEERDESRSEAVQSSGVGTPLPSAPADSADGQTANAEPLVPLEWSDWADSLPAGLDARSSAIECRPVFNSVPIQEAANGAGVPANAEILNSYYTDYGGWSAYSSTYVKEDEYTMVRTKSGEPIWGEWGKWTYYGQMPQGATTPPAPPVSSISGKRQVQTRWYTINGMTPTEYQVREVIGNSSTQYSYCKRQKITVYCDPSKWSADTTIPIQSSDDAIVRCRMQYRFASNGNRLFAVPSMANFPRFTQSLAGVFPDVNDDSWYGANRSDVLRTVYGLAILLPDENMNFNPTGEITLGQTIRAAVIVNRIYNGYTGLLGECGDNVQPYVDYAVAHGIIREGEFTDLSQPVKRQEMAYIFYNAFPAEELAALKKLDRITDMDMSYRYYDCALAMAEAGIINLSDGSQYRPEDTAKRAEAASIIDKLVYPEKRTRD